MSQPFLVAGGPAWIRIRDGNVTAMELFLRHYSARERRKIYQFIGPGEKMPLLTPDARALFAWRKFLDDCIDKRTGERQQGVNCCIFRNEGDELSSWLIERAVDEARTTWPTERLYTYVDPRKVRPTIVRGIPCFGFCFLKAGWKFAGVTDGGKFIWELTQASSVL